MHFKIFQDRLFHRRSLAQLAGSRFIGQVTHSEQEYALTISASKAASLCVLAAFGRGTERNEMRKPEKDQLAEEVLDRWVTFQMALSNKRTYPEGEFTAFAESVRRYVQVVGRDPLIHREVANAINGLVDFLKVERRQVPGAVIYEASRLESHFFSGNDPHFEGDEPPGL